MSLVHQALQKAEREKQRLAPPPAPASAPPPSAPAACPLTATPPLDGNLLGSAAARTNPPVPSAPSSRSFVLAATGLGGLALVLVLALVIWSTGRPPPHAVTNPAPPASAVVAPPDATVATPPLPLPPPATQSAWKLTGISKTPEGPFVAIINGQLRSENEYVDGAVVQRIERDRVILSVNGTELTLRLY